MKNLEVGVGRKIITPPLGVMLMGYAPARPAESIHDDLTISAIALRCGELTAIMISADVCLIKDPQSEHIRRLISQATGVPFEHVILSAIHTHSGPSMRNTPGGSAMDTNYLTSIFEPQAVEAALTATNNFKPAKMGIGTTLSDIGINRREMERSGRIRLGQNPWGCYDPLMTVIHFRSIFNEPIANLIHYGAHCTAAGKGTEVTRDWAGPMVDRLEAESGAITIFFNGALGDCGPRIANGRTVGNIEMAMELGGKAAIEAVKVYRTIKDLRKCDLGVACRNIYLPYGPFPTKESIEKRLAELGDPDKLSGGNTWAYEVLIKRLQELNTGKPLKTHMEINQTVISIGPVAFVPFPFEVFSEITLRIRKYSPYEYTLCMSNANGSNSYFPSQDQICRGGYEVVTSKSVNVYTLANDADDFAVDEVLGLLDALYNENNKIGE